MDMKFALPGKERQDSVYSGLQVQIWYLGLIEYVVKGHSNELYMLYHVSKVFVQNSLQ